MQDDIDDRLKRIERKVDWVAQVAWLAGLAAMVLVLRDILIEIGAGTGPALFGAVGGMIAAGYAGLRAYRLFNNSN
jgi:purine-cytosine permease-like protein